MRLWKICFIDAISKYSVGGFEKWLFCGIKLGWDDWGSIHPDFWTCSFFCKIIWDHFPCDRGMYAWSAEWYLPSPDASLLLARWAASWMRFRSRRSYCFSSEGELVNHLNSQLKKSVDCTDLCDHNYPSFVPSNIFLISMDITCLQLVYLVSVLCEKDFSITGFTRNYINGYSTPAK